MVLSLDRYLISGEGEFSIETEKRRIGKKGVGDDDAKGLGVRPSIIKAWSLRSLPGDKDRHGWALIEY